jgi:hypothetical protein
MNVRTIVSQVGQGSNRISYTLAVRRAYANLAYNTASQPTGGEVPTLDRKLDSIEERIQARRDALGNNTAGREEQAEGARANAETVSSLESSRGSKKGIMSILPGRLQYFPLSQGKW